jgi:hypothetical protein
MAQALHLLKLADQAPQQIRPQDQSFLPHKPSKVATEATQAIFSKGMASMAAKLVASTPVLVELEHTKPLVKVTKPANMEATKDSVATIMAIASNVADGVATTDIKWAHKVAARPW